MPKKIKIGKSHDNDFVISNPTVSRNHAILTVADDNRHAILRDLGSKNGTYVNGVRINQDTSIDFSHQLRFGSENLTLSSILNMTKVVTPSKIDPNSKIIGRGDNCQIRLNHDDVSARHAILKKRSDGSIYIEDCGSRNGTFVNGERIMSRILKKGDRVTITRNYNLDWEKIFPIFPNNKTDKYIWKHAISSAIIIAIIALLGYGIYIWKYQIWNKERIYKEYHSAVCWVYVQYGYKIMLDKEDFTPQVALLYYTQIADGKFPQETIKKRVKYIQEHAQDGSLILHTNESGAIEIGPKHGQGTAFFISEDGKLATNLHITRGWLYENTTEILEDLANKIVAYYATTQNPLLNRSKIEVKVVSQDMVIIPDGLPISEGNAIKVNEIKGYDDINKDVAIIQTEIIDLPSRVKKIIDINKADLSEEAVSEGKTVFTIGFPYGAEIAMSSSLELKNQVHGGSVTQNRGEYEFGHDAATAGGASGSPIINDRGKLVGIHHAGMTGVTGAQGFNMGIKAKYIIELLK